MITQLRNDVTASRKKRQEYLDGWQRNVNERRGKDADTASDEGRSMVPVDWTVTKTKAAQLFSQMPQVRLAAKHPSFSQAVPVFAKVVNDLLTKANVEAVMGEMVVDCINAAGIGACIVRYEALSEQVQVPALDTAALPPDAMAAVEIPKVSVERITDRRFICDRVSPGDLLWPKTFRLSDWNKAPWLGHSARERWAKAKRLLGLKDEDKEKVCGATFGSREDLNQSTPAREGADDMVEYDEVFYWRCLYHEDEKYYDAIQRVVFVAGLEEPIINEPWKGQQFDEENGGYIGSCLLPIRILTLHYISDEAIPPSDSAIIRPQVKELQESRNHMREQRKHSRPLRWFDLDRVDPSMTADLIKGTWAGMIPTIGPGDKAIGEVSRSAYPRENVEFDRMLQQDIQAAVGVGPNQGGTFATGEAKSASEAQIVQQSFQTEIGQQRAKVASCFVSIAEVFMGLWCLYGVVEPTGIGAAIGEDGAQKLETWDRKRINQKFIADIRADSTVRLDAQQMVAQITSVINIAAQSGFLNPKPLIAKIIELNGMDPTECMVDPQPKGPEPPKISYSFKADDFVNPMVTALILDSGLTPEKVQAAKIILAQLFDDPKPPQGGPQGPPPPAGPGPAGPEGPGPDMPIPEPDIPDKPFPQWESAPRINTRRAEG